MMDQAADDDLRPENEFDYSNANRDRIYARLNDAGKSSPSTQISAKSMARQSIKIFAIAGSCALVGCALLALFMWWQSWRETESEAENVGRRMPALVPAPTVAQQNQLVAAIRAHPNPPLDIDSFLPAGADAGRLGVLFGVMGPPQSLEDGSIRRQLVLNPRPTQGYDTTFLVVDVAGQPPRVVRRFVETYFNSAY